MDEIPCPEVIEFRYSTDTDGWHWIIKVKNPIDETDLFGSTREFLFEYGFNSTERSARRNIKRACKSLVRRYKKALAASKAQRPVCG